MLRVCIWVHVISVVCLDYYLFMCLTGMACFLFILGFILMTVAACYISPYVCGSMKEKRMLRAPEELEAPYAPSGPGGNVTNV
jgi:hypothetical protein